MRYIILPVLLLFISCGKEQKNRITPKAIKKNESKWVSCEVLNKSTQKFEYCSSFTLERSKDEVSGTQIIKEYTQELKEKCEKYNQELDLEGHFSNGVNCSSTPNSYSDHGCLFSMTIHPRTMIVKTFSVAPKEFNSESKDYCDQMKEIFAENPDIFKVQWVKR